MGWFEALTEALQKEDSPVMQFATIDGDTARVRSLLQRGSIAASTHPSRPLILSTTDVRTPKVPQIGAHPRTELVYWMPRSLSQFRIAGRAAVVPASGPGALPADGVYGALAREGYDWARKRVEVFNALSARMRATWCWPPPGTPLRGDEEWVETLPRTDEATGAEAALVEVALGNFALLLVEPAEVDWLEFQVTPTRRTKFEWDEQAGEFRATSIAP